MLHDLPRQEVVPHHPVGPEGVVNELALAVEAKEDDFAVIGQPEADFVEVLAVVGGPVVAHHVVVRVDDFVDAVEGDDFATSERPESAVLDTDDPVLGVDGYSAFASAGGEKGGSPT